MARYSRWEIDAAIEASQLARDEARKGDPSWRLVPADDGLGGMIWKQASERVYARLYGKD